MMDLGPSGKLGWRLGSMYQNEEHSGQRVNLPCLKDLFCGLFFVLGFYFFPYVSLLLINYIILN